MKLNIETIAAALAIAFVAYTMGMQRAQQQTVGTANEITDAGQWWTYPGQWS
jgi:hypothetical protein